MGIFLQDLFASVTRGRQTRVGEREGRCFIHKPLRSWKEITGMGEMTKEGAEQHLPLCAQS
jgi:hypothetical protein